MKIIIYSINDVYETQNLARFRQFVDDHRAEHKPDGTITTLNGDFLSPSTLSLFDSGENIIQVMNTLNLDYIVLGNHEFDMDCDIIKKRLDELDERVICLNSNVTFTEHDVRTIPYHVHEVKGFRIGLCGLLTEDTLDFMAIAKGPNQPVRIEPVLKCAQRHLDTLHEKEKANGGLDYMIAITHQLVPADRTMAKECKGLDLILGGHEHDPYLEEYHNGEKVVPIIKVGYDASHVGVVTIEIEDSPVNIPTNVEEKYGENKSKITTSYERIDIQNYPASNANVQAVADIGQKMLEKIRNFILVEPPEKDSVYGPLLSSKNPRVQQTTVGSMFCDLVRDFYGADVCVITGGKIRCNADYPNGMTPLDIFAELPFPDNFVFNVVCKGKYIEESIRYSRTEAKGQGGYLQHCTNCAWDDDSMSMTAIKGQPFEPEKLYTFCVPLSLLKGMDKNPILTKMGEPLLADGGEIAKVDTHDILLLQQVVIKRLVARQWNVVRENLGLKFEDFGPGSDGKVSKQQFLAFLRANEELAVFIPESQWDLFFDTLDNDDDRAMTREEFEGICDSIQKDPEAFIAHATRMSISRQGSARRDLNAERKERLAQAPVVMSGSTNSPVNQPGSQEAAKASNRSSKSCVLL